MRQLTEDEVPKIVEAYRQGDMGAFHALLSSSMSKVVDAWGIPPDLSKGMELSQDQFIKMSGAIRATVVCVALYNEHPLILRATNGDRRAVLDLVKADKLFCMISVAEASSEPQSFRTIEHLSISSKERWPAGL